MLLYIMYFSLKDEVSEEEFAKKSTQWLSYVEDKLEEHGSPKTTSTPLFRR